jgi:hypothetical protein
MSISEPMHMSEPEAAAPRRIEVFSPVKNWQAVIDDFRVLQ